MDLPVIETPIFPRWVWMEEITFSHIPIATLITAFLVLAPIYEYVGYRTKDLRYDRLAKSMVFFVMILFSPGAALGTGIAMFIIGLYPEFWARWSNLFFWPLMAQFVFFTLEVIFLFFFYYLLWDRWKNRKRLHIFFGVLAALSGLCVQFVWDALGAYMTTPSVELPMVNEPVGWSSAAFFNPSMAPLFLHRFFGNISYSMLLTGGVFALKHWRQKDPNEKAYFGFAADFTFTVGFLAFFAMPFVGWFYAQIMQQHAPVAFHAVMGGHTAPHFTIKMGLISLMLLLGGGYLFTRHKRKAILAAMTLGMATLYIFLHMHPPLRWLPGEEAVWRGFYTAALIAVIGFFWYLSRSSSAVKEIWKWAMFVAGLSAFLAFLFGGFVRERSRQPYSVYEQLVKPEILPREADRFLLYDKCIGCHHTSLKDLTRFAVEDWDKRVEIEARRPGADISEEEARRISRYLKEHHP
ncbi:MAG: cytochrome ubiquinol oxidase subunit I [Desulfatiglandales bacterium]